MARYIHNTTFIVERSLAARFEDWARNVYMKAVKDSLKFDSVTMSRILTEVDPMAINYSIQLESCSMERSEAWHRDVAALLKDDLASRLGRERVMFFSTDMEVLDNGC